jgi:hypothetical protein
MAIFESRMSFIQPWDESRGNPFVRGAADEGFERCNYGDLEYSVRITDARPRKYEFNIDTHGFGYFDDPNITPELLEILRANDKPTVAKEYYPYIEEFVKKSVGATKVVIFDHTIRRRDPALNKKDNPTGREQPASLVCTWGS